MVSGTWSTVALSTAKEVGAPIATHDPNDDGVLVAWPERDTIAEPWRLRVKGPFTLLLDNAGVVNVEVAGRRIPHGQSVGETWAGRFDGEGRWLRPAPPELPEGAPLPDDDEAEGGTKP